MAHEETLPFVLCLHTNGFLFFNCRFNFLIDIKPFRDTDRPARQSARAGKSRGVQHRYREPARGCHTARHWRKPGGFKRKRGSKTWKSYRPIFILQKLLFREGGSALLARDRTGPITSGRTLGCVGLRAFLPTQGAERAAALSSAPMESSLTTFF